MWHIPDRRRRCTVGQRVDLRCEGSGQFYFDAALRSHLRLHQQENRSSSLDTGAIVRRWENRQWHTSFDGCYLNKDRWHFDHRNCSANTPGPATFCFFYTMDARSSTRHMQRTKQTKILFLFEWLFRCSDVPYSARNEKVDKQSDRGDSREQF